MAEHSYTSRQELDQYAFHPAVSLLVPVAAVLLQAVLPRLWWRLDILDLPLLTVIFFAVARRSPISGTFTGMLTGLFQDGLTVQPFGFNGIAKSIIGYLGASIGFAVDVDNPINRAIMTFAFCALQSVILFTIERILLAQTTVHPQFLHELLRATVNTAISIPLFLLLDNFRMRE